jgi:hypothetical protein
LVAASADFQKQVKSTAANAEEMPAPLVPKVRVLLLHQG